jgi:hypothetical protein
VSTGQTVVARHPRLYGRDGEQLDPLHYLQVLERKPGAFDLARPIQRWAKEWPPIYRRYLAALRERRADGATREFVRILQLHARYPQAVLVVALERALATHCCSADGVEQLARQATTPAAAHAATSPVELAAVPSLTRLAHVAVPPPDLRQFNRLLAPAGAAMAPAPPMGAPLAAPAVVERRP